MHPDNIRGKYTSVYGNVYVKIPIGTKCGKISHRSMGTCVRKFLEIQNVCESLDMYMEKVKQKIKVFARMKLLLNIYRRKIDFAVATV
jgi:hypothetical protein